MRKKEEESEDWKDIALHFAVGTMREMGNTIIRSFHEKIDGIAAAIARKFFSMLFLGVGMVFLLVGIAQLIGMLAGGFAFIGYILVGAFSVCIALLLSVVKR